jgi:hypothetical protein
MSKSVKIVAADMLLLIMLMGVILSGCGTTETYQNQSSSSGQQSSTPSGQSTGQAATQQPSSSAQQPSGSPGQQPPGGIDNTEVLTRAAEILGVSSDDFITAFQNAMPQGMPSGSGQQGQPPTSQSGQQGESPTPPSGQQGQPPTGIGQGMSQSQFMTDIYEKMAEELNISADDIANAIQQATEELQND